MLLEILSWPDPRLMTVCERAEPSKAVSQLAEDMLETMYAAPGRGLAAPQVGALLRLFVMDVVWKEGPAEPRIFLNPEIIDPSQETGEMVEGCLSLPGLVLPVRRPSEITMRWQDLTGAWQEERLTGMAAICAQHEFDHLNGQLTLDRAAPDALAAVEDALAELRLAPLSLAPHGLAPLVLAPLGVAQHGVAEPQLTQLQSSEADVISALSDAPNRTGGAA